VSASLGFFDPELCSACWFDSEVSELAAWFDPDLIVCGVAVAEEEVLAGKWSNYRRKRRQGELELVMAWEYEGTGGLEFSGDAWCLHVSAPQVVRYRFIGAGGVTLHHGAASVLAVSYNRILHQAAGGVPALAGAGAFAHACKPPHVLRIGGRGALAPWSGGASIETGRRGLSLVFSKESAHAGLSNPRQGRGRKQRQDG